MGRVFQIDLQALVDCIGRTSLGNGIEKEIVALMPRLRRFACALTGSVEEADDVLQGALERAIKNQALWQKGTRLDSWMYRIVQNHFLNTVRDGKTRNRYHEQAGAETAIHTDERPQTEARLTLVAVQKEMQKLDPEQRVVMELICIEGHSYTEVAEILEIPIGTVTSRLARGRIALKKALYEFNETS